MIRTLAVAFLLSLVLFTSVSAQSTKMMPTKVQAQFKKQYPYATKVKWDISEDNRFVANFKMDIDRHGATYDSTGKRIEHSKELRSIAEVPYDVSAAFEKAYPDAKVQKIEEVKRETGQLVFSFDVKRKGAATIEEVIFNTKGKELEEEEEEDAKK